MLNKLNCKTYCMHSLCALGYNGMHYILVFELVIKEEEVICIQDSFRLP